MLVPLMLSLDPKATSKTSESQPETRLKPQLHTQKNHSSYNGTRTLPIATRVRPLFDPKSDHDCQSQCKDKRKQKYKRKSQHRNQEEESPLYEVTLYYPHNRACTIYRSREDFSLLRTGLHSRSSSTAPQPLATPPSSDNLTEGQKDPKEVAKWDSLLRKAVERFAKNGYGRHSVEWFLRRRLGDCERMASGKGTGLPTCTTRRMKIKQPRNVDAETKTTDEGPANQDDRAGNTGSTDEAIVAREGNSPHDTSEEEEEDKIKEQGRGGNEDEIVKSESVEDEEMHDNNCKPSYQKWGKSDISPDNSPTAERPKGKKFTEIVFGLDCLPVEPFKPIPDLGKLAGSSLAKRRKNRQNAGHGNQKTAHSIDDVLQSSINGAGTLTWDSELGFDTREDSSSEGATVLTPTSGSVHEMSPGDRRPNSALMYMFMVSRRASDPDLGQKFFSLHDVDDNGTNTL